MILITGGTGFLGRYLVDEFLGRGYEVRLLVRNAEERQLPWGSLIEVISGDILDISALKKSMEGVEYVVHAAAVVGFASSQREAIKRINIEGTANVVNVALDTQVKKLVHISSIAATGRKGSGETVDEETPWNDGAKKSTYAISKYKAEYEVHRGVAEGLPSVMVNPGMILGPGDWTQGTPKIFNIIAKGMMFYNAGVTGYVGAKDVAIATAQALQSDFEKGERFLLVSENLSQREFFTQIATALGGKPPSIKFPPSLAPLLGMASEAWSTLRGRTPVMTRESLSRINHKTYFNAEKSKRLGFTYTPIKKVIEETAAAFLREKK